MIIPTKLTARKTILSTVYTLDANTMDKTIENCIGCLQIPYTPFVIKPAVDYAS